MLASELISMRNLLPTNLSCSICFLLLLSCQKNANNPAPPPPVDPLAEKVTASISGRVLDENSKPVGNALVQASGATVNTDINGFFRLNNIQLAKNAGFVTVEKTGYLKGIRTIFTNAGVVNNVEIQLIPKTTRGNFTASAGGNISIQNGSSVNFPASSVINAATNSAYSGIVTVIGAYLDPTDPKLPLIMPGNLTGLTTNNEQKVLQTFGMMAVELEGSNGEKLNLASGKTATITMPIPSSLQATAPATIPLWYFDETKGIWKEEGSATKQGNNYVGTVSHFSFWNCDVPNNFVNLKLKLQDQNSQPAAGYNIELRNIQNNSMIYIVTDSSGGANGGIPANAAFEMKVYTKCGLIHTQNIGPLVTATDLGTITTTSPPSATITVSGTTGNCNMAAITNGFVDVAIDGSLYRTAIVKGNFSITISRCNDMATTAQIIATDEQTSQKSNPVSLNVTSGNYQSGNIIACGTPASQYINFSFGNTNINFIPPTDSLTAFWNGTATTFNAWRKVFIDTATYQNLNLYFGGKTTGVYPIGAFELRDLRGILYSKTAPLNIIITEYGNVNEFIAGSFSGGFKENRTGIIDTGTFNFRIKREH
jgi:hypothetical protein